MTAGDLAAVEAIAAEVHPAYPESGAVPAERLRLFPAGCFVLYGGVAIEGYVVSHPWAALDPPKLDTLLGRLPSPAGTYYVHDLALLPSARGQGLADAIVKQLLVIAKNAGLPSTSLVAVNRSTAFWARHGFVAVADPAIEAALRSYDGDAAYMVRGLTRPG
jgi:GNAT superfamily N-acetyltransferase